MPTLDPLASSARTPWTPTAGSGGPVPSPAGSIPSVGAAGPRPDVSYDAAVTRLRVPPLDLGAIVARMDPVATKLDQAKAAASGPYTVNGATVTSGAQFRIANGWNEANVETHGGILMSAARSVGVAGPQVMLLTEGRGDSASLTKLTQALIDAGQLPQGSKAPIADQIHDLQWRFGIGMDCAGYVYRALATVHGDLSKLGLKSSDYENFTGLVSNPHFTQCSPSEARAGDVIVLQGSPTDPHDPGHNLIVRSHASLSPILDPALTTDRNAHDFAFDSNGTMKPGIQVFEVDSSFGAGTEGDVSGGVRRDILLYNPNAKAPEAQWCTCKSTTPPLTSLDRVPYREHALTGFFRAKVTP